MANFKCISSNKKNGMSIYACTLKSRSNYKYLNINYKVVKSANKVQKKSELKWCKTVLENDVRSI